MSGPVTRRVVLLHGLWMPGVAMHRLAVRLRAAGFEPEVFRYPTIAGGPARAVPRLAAHIRAGGPAHVVAHSLGGLVALQALCEDPGLPVARVVCLGSPLRGSRAAAGIARWPLAARLLGQSRGLLQGGFDCWRGQVEVGMVAGRMPLGLGALFGHFRGAHDGTVAVEETRLEGLAAHVVVAASHSGLLFSPEVARQVVAFLREGAFAA